MAAYCFLRHPNSHAELIHEAVFIGGDTDTVACMAGAISGTVFGIQAIPLRWRDALAAEAASPAEVPCCVWHR